MARYDSSSWRKAKYDSFSSSRFVSIPTTDRDPPLTSSLRWARYDADGLRILLEDLNKALSSPSIGPELQLDGILNTTLAAEADHDGSHEHFWRAHVEHVRYVIRPDLHLIKRLTCPPARPNFRISRQLILHNTIYKRNPTHVAQRSLSWSSSARREELQFRR